MLVFKDPLSRAAWAAGGLASSWELVASSCYTLPFLRLGVLNFFLMILVHSRSPRPGVPGFAANFLSDLRPPVAARRGSAFISGRVFRFSDHARCLGPVAVNC
jgi:hypothetical protein